jgi:Ca-activated chloride channel homolog
MQGIEFSDPWLLGFALLPLLLSILLIRGRRSAPSVDCPAVGWGGQLKPRGIWLRMLVRQLPIAAMLALVPVMAGIRSPGTARSLPPSAVMLLLDTSSSMTAEDFQPSRMEAARKLLAEFVHANPSVEIGLVTFSGTSRLVVPVTPDHESVVTGLGTVRPAAYGEDGTSIGTGLGSTLNRLRSGQWAARKIILITDGVSNRGQLAPSDAAKFARLMGVVIDTIGMGTDSVSRFWVPGPEGEQLEARARIDIDDAALSELSRTTGGEYRRVRSAGEMRKALVDSAMRGTPAPREREDGSRIWIYLLSGAALALIFGEFLLSRFAIGELPGS